MAFWVARDSRCYLKYILHTGYPVIGSRAGRGGLLGYADSLGTWRPSYRLASDKLGRTDRWASGRASQGAQGGRPSFDGAGVGMGGMEMGFRREGVGDEAGRSMV